MKTKGLWYIGTRQLEIRAMEIPVPGPRDVLVAMEACGICSWDVVAYAGNFGQHHAYPFCAGHEGIGRVIEAGSMVKNIYKGQRVAVHEAPIGEPGGAHMACHACRPEAGVTVLPDDNRPIHHWIIAEPVCCVLNGIMYLDMQPGDKVAVVGAGFMGLLFIQALRRCLTHQITAIDINPHRLELARQFGADEIINPKVDNLPEKITKGFDIVIETAGTVDSMNLTMRLARAGAIIEVFAWHHHTQTFNLEDWHVNGWRILNIQPGMNPYFTALFPRAINLLTNGTFTANGLITHTGSINRAAEVFEAAIDKAGGYIKGVLMFK